MSNTSRNSTRDPKPTSERIQQLADRVMTGDIALPEFQRPFVWTQKQVRNLLDSIYHNYPIGSLLVWESREDLESKRKIADLEVNPRSESYPVNYLLDGQQRLSAICGVLNWEPGDPKSIWNVTFDLKTEKFNHASSLELPKHVIPLRWLSNPSTFYKNIFPLEDDSLKDRADHLFNRFKDYQLPLVTLGDMPLKDVGPIFERINSTGTKLTIYDLMRAATWSPDFDLGQTVDSIRTSLEPKNFSDLENKTLLRALAEAAGNDFSSESIEALRNLATEDLNEAAKQTRESAERAADFLSTQIKATGTSSLPYANQFPVLCEIFRLIPHPNSQQMQQIEAWFWGTTLSGYFAGWDSANMSQDAQSVRTWAKGGTTQIETKFVPPTFRVWQTKAFRTNSAVSKMLALMLAHGEPLDLINGQRIDVGKSLAWNNDKEYHHFFPKNYLTKVVGRTQSEANVVANMILLTSRSNITIKDKAPSAYLREILKDVGEAELRRRLESNLVPGDALDFALHDDYDGFLSRRSEFLHEQTDKLSGLGLLSTQAATQTAASSRQQNISADDSDDDVSD